jgi:hypothetical protein
MTPTGTSPDGPPGADLPVAGTALPGGDADTAAVLRRTGPPGWARRPDWLLGAGRGDRLGGIVRVVAEFVSARTGRPAVPVVPGDLRYIGTVEGTWRP